MTFSGKFKSLTFYFVYDEMQNFRPFLSTVKDNTADRKNKFNFRDCIVFVSSKKNSGMIIWFASINDYNEIVNG